jgi:hypothetical protein
MARAKDQGNGRLEEAIANLAQSQNNLSQAQANLLQAQAGLVQTHATLVQTQASLTQNHAAFQAEVTALRREMRELERITADRFARIEGILLEHTHILSEHGRLIQALTDAVREKIGFKAPGQPAG